MNKKMYSSSDFEANQLPETRKQLFGFLFKNNFFLFVRMGIIFLLFALPIIVVHFFKDYSYITAHEQNINNFAVVVGCSIAEIFCLMIIAIPVAGFSKIYRELVWLEPVFFLSDFKEGIKQNIKPNLITFFIIGLLQLMFDIINYFQISGFILAIPFGFLAVVFFPIFMHAIFVNALYSNKYFVNFKLACFLYIKHLPTTLLYSSLICAFKIYDLFHFTNVLALLTKNLIFVIIFVFLIPFIVLAAQLNEMRIFDNRINNIRFPDLIDRGLHKKTNSK